MASPDAFTVLAAHVLHTLPDDPREQKELLQAIYSVVQPKHPAWKPVARALVNATRMVRDMDSLKRNAEQAQLKFAQIKSGTTPAK